MQNPDDHNTPGIGKDPERFVDKRTDERIRQHLTNEEDSISAEDINNVQSNIHSPQPVTSATDDNNITQPAQRRFF